MIFEELSLRYYSTPLAIIYTPLLAARIIEWINEPNKDDNLDIVFKLDVGKERFARRLTRLSLVLEFI